MKILSFFRWMTVSTLRTFAGIVVLFILTILGIRFAQAAPIANWQVHNEPQMRLHVNITTTQTADIKISPGELNGTSVNFLTTTGGVLRLRRGITSTYSEDIYFRSATIDSNGVATLQNVTRNVCRSLPTTIQSCGDGREFYAGDIVELTVDARQLNWKLNLNTVNVMTESGAIRGTQTGNAIIRLNAVTTTQRNSFTSGPGNGDMIYNSTVGAPQFYAGGAWYSFGSGAALINASHTARGGVEIATPANIAASALTDDSGAPLCIATDTVIRTSSGAINNRNKVVATNNSGYLSGALLGTSVSATRFLRGDMTWAFAGSGVNVLTSTGKTLVIDKAINSAAWTQVSPALDITGFVSSGSTVQFNFMAQVFSDSSAGCNILVSRGAGTSGLIFTGGSGAYMLNHLGSDFTAPYVISWVQRINTGGTLTFSPRCRVNTTGQISIQAPARFTVTRISQ